VHSKHGFATTLRLSDTASRLRSGDEWEEVHGEEAEAALTQFAKRGAAQAERREPPLAETGGAEASDADMVEAEDAEGAPYIALAGNGVELVRPCPSVTAELALTRAAGADCRTSYYWSPRVHPLLSPAPSAC